MSSVISHFYRFGDFTIDTDQRVLMRDGNILSVTPKVFETLLILIEHHGRIVEKDELMNRIWPDSFVEEANLTFNIQQIRKALGDNARKPVYVETVARRGYRFIAEVEEVLRDSSARHNQISVRLEGYETEKEKQEGEFLIANQRKHLTEQIAAKTQNTFSVISFTKRQTFFIAATLSVIILFGVGFLIWLFGNDFKRNENENKKTAFNSALPLLKIEKMTATGKSSEPVISPDGKFVAYVNETKGRFSIWLRQLATNTSREIVQASNERIYGLAFARNGENLYFARGESENQPALYRVALIGGLPAKLISNSQGTFSISPDNKQIAFIRYSDDNKKCALMISDGDGINERELVVHTQPERFNAPAWSPDGKSIAVAVGPSDSGSREVSIVEINVADSTKREMTSDRWFHIKRMEWLPNKIGLIMSGEKTAGDGSQLWRISYPTGEVSQITEGVTSYQTISITTDASKAVASQMSLVSDIWVGSANKSQNLKRITQATTGFYWMPDGQIVHSSNASVRKDLWVMKPDGTEQRQLTNVGQNGIPVVSSDNRYIVFISNRSGSNQVWRMNSDGSDQIQLTNIKAAHTLSISPDSKWVIYSLADSWHLWKVSINGGEPVRLTDYKSMCPSVSPDGKVIAFIGRDSKNKRKILIVPFDGGMPLMEYEFATPELSATRLQWTPDGKGVIYAALRNGLTSLFKQSLGSNAPERLIDLNEDNLFDFGYSPDGKYLAAIRGSWQYDIVLITNFNQ